MPKAPKDRTGKLRQKRWRARLKARLSELAGGRAKTIGEALDLLEGRARRGEFVSARSIRALRRQVHALEQENANLRATVAKLSKRGT